MEARAIPSRRRSRRRNNRVGDRAGDCLRIGEPARAAGANRHDLVAIDDRARSAAPGAPQGR
jgi:hypothetical protein